MVAGAAAAMVAGAAEVMSDRAAVPAWADIMGRAAVLVWGAAGRSMSGCADVDSAMVGVRAAGFSKRCAADQTFQNLGGAVPDCDGYEGRFPGLRDFPARLSRRVGL